MLFRYLQCSGQKYKYLALQFLYLQYREYRSGVTELVFVFLNSNVVRAVVDMDRPVLCAQPHRRLRGIVLTLPPLSQFSLNIQKQLTYL